MSCVVGKPIAVTGDFDLVPEGKGCVDLSSMTIIEGDTGLIVIDPLTSMGGAPRVARHGAAPNSSTRPRRSAKS